MTRRHRLPYLHFTLETPDGTQSETFLSFPGGRPVIDWNVFSTLGVTALSLADDCRSPVILDEIGGIELLCPDFFASLEALLTGSVPIIGVIKSDTAPLIHALGLTESYEAALHRLHTLLVRGEHALVYSCGKFDETAFVLAQNWAKEYCP